MQILLKKKKKKKTLMILMAKTKYQSFQKEQNSQGHVN